jgi:hypothetical protein
LSVDVEFGKALGTLGVGGAISGVLAYFYHRLAESHEKKWTELTERWETMMDNMNVIVRENTVAFTRCVETIQSMQRQLDKWDGLERRGIKRGT